MNDIEKSSLRLVSGTNEVMGKVAFSVYQNLWIVGTRMTGK